MLPESKKILAVKRQPSTGIPLSGRSFDNLEDGVETPMSVCPDLNKAQQNLLRSIHSPAFTTRDYAGRGLRSAESSLANLINPFFFDLK
jgi:hypothetical protein